jgi:hypothetical protein
MRRANNTFKMKMSQWVKHLTGGIKSVIDNNINKDLPLNSKLALEKEINTDRLQHAKRCIVSIMLIHRAVYTNHIDHLFKEVRRIFSTRYSVDACQRILVKLNSILQTSFIYLPQI